MKLLIITQVVDTQDSNLGFFHRWIEEFAQHCESVVVICLRKGIHNLPHNVRVLSLGKEERTSRLTRVRRFFSYIRGYKDEYDVVFVHMNPEYIALGGWLWRRWHKKVGLWYAHKSVTRQLSFAMRFIDIVFSVAQDSFRVPTSRLKPVGHGIDTELFKPDMREGSIETRLVTTGRISPSKHIIEMLRVLDVLYERGEKFLLTIVGEAITPQEEAYAKKLKGEIEARPFKEKIRMIGPVPHNRLPALLNMQDLFLNFSTTGNMDKAGLEALAVGVPVITTNDAFRGLLEPFGLFVSERDYVALADAINRSMHRPDRAAIVATLRGKVVADHSLSRLIPIILRVYEEHPNG
jgi:glycosyltransferase involved in cell wall biosynthesis